MIVSLLVLCSGWPLWAAETGSRGPSRRDSGGEAPDVLISATRTPTSMGREPSRDHCVGRAIAAATGRPASREYHADSDETGAWSCRRTTNRWIPGTSLKIRGRSIAILIDGVPQQSSPTTELDLATLIPAPSSASKSSAVPPPSMATARWGSHQYHYEAAGRGQTKLLHGCAGERSLTRVLRGLSGTVVQGFQGKKDWFDYNIVGSFNHQGGCSMRTARAPCPAPIRSVDLPTPRTTTS